MCAGMLSTQTTKLPKTLCHQCSRAAPCAACRSPVLLVRCALRQCQVLGQRRHPLRGAVQLRLQRVALGVQLRHAGAGLGQRGVRCRQRLVALLQLGGQVAGLQLGTAQLGGYCLRCRAVECSARLRSTATTAGTGEQRCHSW